VGAKLGGVRGVAIAVAVVMGIGASVWFWLAVSHAAKWHIMVLLKPVILPTLIITIALLTVINLPLSASLESFLQAFLLIAIYVVGLSIFSIGRIPKLFVHLVKRSLYTK
jgi:ABC-type spermidine/putrescine transport system permease subunit II